MDSVILGISLGTRTIGLAVFAENDLIEWRIKSYKGAWNSKKQKYILKGIQKFMEEYRVNTVAIKKHHPSRTSPRIKSLMSAFLQICKVKGIRYKTYTISELHEYSCFGRRKNKAYLLEFIMKRKREVYLDYCKEQKNKNPYYLKLFEAIACCELAINSKK